MNQNTGTVVVSIDLELSWGNGGKQSYVPLHKNERHAIAAFLKLCEQYQISCTWATVGNLFLSSKKEAQERGIELYGRAHHVYDTMIVEGCDESLWFGEDIIRMLLACAAPQEIGCHAFFHTLAHEVGPEEYVQELTQAMRLAKDKYDISMRSFVHPRNMIGHLDVLQRVGFQNYRGVTPATHPQLSSRLQRVADIGEALLGRPAPVAHAKRITDSFYEIPATYFLGSKLWKRISTPRSSRMRTCTQGVDRAIHEGALLHLWFHPHNIASDTTTWLESIEHIFMKIARERESGRLVVQTMGEVTDTMKLSCR